MARKPLPLPNLLLVEGKDDEHTIYALVTHYKVPETFRVKNKEGDSNLKKDAFAYLLETLDTELDASGLENLGIVIDADEDLAKRWESLSQLLRNVGYADIPVSPTPDGTIIVQESRPTVGIWLMPDNQLPGMLEHFIEFLVPPDDILWERARNCVASIPENERPFRPQHQIKADIYTWLAWKEQPGKPLGQSITMRYFDANLPQAQTFISWIQRLFVGTKE